MWTEDGIEAYEKILKHCLADLRARWGNQESRSSIFILLSSTYSCLSLAAQSTNKCVGLGNVQHLKPKICPTIRPLEKLVLKARRALENTLACNPTPIAVDAARDTLRNAKMHLRQAVRNDASRARQSRDNAFSKLISNNPSEAFAALRSSKNASTNPIQNLKVGDKIYSGKAVCDGFYDSLSSLKGTLH